MNFAKIIAVLFLIVVSLTNLAFAAGLSSVDLADSSSLIEWPMKVTSFGGKLLLSDSPETVSEDGILYQDTVQGNIRVFFHHVNGTPHDKKIAILLTNPDKDNDALITVLRHGLGGPSSMYVDVGKKTQFDYFADDEVYLLSVGAGKSLPLSEALTKLVVKTNMLVNGIYDFTADRPVTVSVLMLPAHQDPLEFYKTATVLPADAQRLRGTFEGKDRLLMPLEVFNPRQTDAVTITLADNSTDKYLQGIDATDGSPVINYGNYGIMYRVFVSSSFGGQYQVLLNPRGGEYAGALKMKYRHQAPYTLLTPQHKLSFGINTVKEAESIGNFVGGQSLWLTFSPPGASNLPVKLLLLPKP